MVTEEVRKLKPSDAVAIVECFGRVYGESYGNELFHRPEMLARAIADGDVMSVGAVMNDGRILAHMAMTSNGVGATPELGNTAVDPIARGRGLAWKVGEELIEWCQELGNTAFLQYPTTDHHVMQREAAKHGNETGLMLSYIPAETDGKIRSGRRQLRQGATIVYHRIGANVESSEIYLPDYFHDEIKGYVESCRLQRQYMKPLPDNAPTTSVVEERLENRRGLARLTVVSGGLDLETRIADFASKDLPCLQIDFLMNDAYIDSSVGCARAQEFVFSGWLPGYRKVDVFRMQRVASQHTDLCPLLVNRPAQILLSKILRDIQP
ncbi:MAG: GNAT family N-acetyltransferase [Pseudomonadota bacterium]